MGHKPRVDSTRGLALLHANNCNGIRKEEWKEWDLSHVYLYNLALHSNGSSSDLGVGCDC